MKYNKTQESGDAPLPCLNSNISTEGAIKATGNASPRASREGVSGIAKLSTQHRKSAFVLKESIQLLAERYGLESLGFLTLTFRQHITCPKEAQRRLNSLLTHVIKPRYREYVGVMERQKSGRIHYHLLVVLGTDIRTGFDFDALTRRDYSSASDDLRAE